MNVKALSLRYFSDSSIYYADPDNPREILPPSLFLCDRISSLTLYDCIVSEIPTGVGGFNNLTQCCLGNVEFEDDTLALFLSQCPLLQRLRLESCDVPQKITISAPHIEDLFIDIVYGLEILTINCPKLRELSLISYTKDLRVNGLLFQELSSEINELYMDRDGTVIEISLHMNLHGANNLSAARRCAVITGTFKLLKRLSIHYFRFLNRLSTIPTTNLLQGLPHLERLFIPGEIDLVRFFYLYFVSYYMLVWSNNQVVIGFGFSI